MRDKRGFALLAVVWLVVLFGAAALGWNRVVRVPVMGLTNAVLGIEARAAARAGLAVSRATMDRRLAMVADPDDPFSDPWLLMSDLHLTGPASPGSEARWRARVIDLSARLNINTVDASQFRRFLLAIGIEARRASRIVDSTLDWRDADDSPRPDGGEGHAYLERGAPRLPTNEPFANVEEWAFVEGVSHTLVDSVGPFLATHGSGRVNLLSAPDPVVRSLRGMSEEAVTALRGGEVRSLSALEEALSPIERSLLRENLPWLVSRAAFTSEELEISVEGIVGDGRVQAHLVAIVVRSGRESTVRDLLVR